MVRNIFRAKEVKDADKKTTGENKETAEPADPPLVTYLPWSIFNLLCCFPIGLAAVFFSCQARKYIDSGNKEKAFGASETAMKLNMSATVTAIFLVVILFIFAVLGGMKILAHT